jgi:hypothetical protein
MFVSQVKAKSSHNGNVFDKLIQHLISHMINHVSSMVSFSIYLLPPPFVVCSSIYLYTSIYNHPYLTLYRYNANILLPICVHSFLIFTFVSSYSPLFASKTKIHSHRFSSLSLLSLLLYPSFSLGLIVLIYIWYTYVCMYVCQVYMLVAAYVYLPVHPDTAPPRCEQSPRRRSVSHRRAAASRVIAALPPCRATLRAAASPASRRKPFSRRGTAAAAAAAAAATGEGTSRSLASPPRGASPGQNRFRGDFDSTIRPNTTW